MIVQHRRPRYRSLIAPFVAMALVITACAGGGTGPSPAAEPGAAQSPAGTSAATSATSEGIDLAEVSERELVFAHITPETFPYQDGALEFKRLVEERSEGKITVNVFPAGQLGAERDIEEGIL
jgi:TRAP-type C4-dicarboxylate transport system substrate-binding protein